MSTFSTSSTFTPVLCSYINNTKQIQIVKIDSLANRNLERVIFPDEVFLFEAPAVAQLDIYINLAGKMTLLERISCSRLKTMTIATKTLELTH